jgi:hypothetical protein
MPAQKLGRTATQFFVILQGFSFRWFDVYNGFAQWIYKRKNAAQRWAKYIVHIFYLKRKFAFIIAIVYITYSATKWRY